MKSAVWFSVVGLAMLVLSCPNALAGQFKYAHYYHAGERPYQIASADLNHDGYVDLAIADWLSNQLIILLGNGDGTFQKQTIITVDAPGALAVGDFNEDGNLDLAIVQEMGTGDGNLLLYLGNGKGGFRESSTYTIGGSSTSLAVGDLNGDGHLDVVVTDRGFNGPGDVIIFFGNGKGKLRQTKKYTMSGGPFRAAVGDLSGDGLPDIAVTLFDSGKVAIFLNEGAGKFRKPALYDAGGYGVVGVVVTDLRNGGKEDLVFSNQAAGMVVLLNNGDGTFGKPTVYMPNCTECQSPEACVVADFNLDGELDAACVSDYGEGYVFYGDGKGGFPKQAPFNETIKNVGGYSLAAGDFNNDGAPDLAIPIQNDGKVAIMLNTR